MNRLFPLLILSLAVLTAFGQRTTRSHLKAQPEVDAYSGATVVEEEIDTVVAPEAHLVDVNGYDKPLRSRRETFFVTNNSEQPVQGMAFTIDYYDTNGRQLHSAHHQVDVEIPATETRQVSVRSWDKQQSFYYRQSAAPERAQQATPYDIKLTVDTIFFKK